MVNAKARIRHTAEMQLTGSAPLRVIVAEPTENTVVDPRTWFDVDAPLELEIGCGKGGFLLARARAHPEVHFLGIEWANQFFLYSVDRMVRWEMKNVRLMRTDAKQLVMRHLAPECLSALHLYHPDPWPKKRHHKRRLVQRDFADAAARCLRRGALWYIQSDHEEYFLEIRDVLDAHPEFECLAPAAVEAAFGPEWAGTNFEKKYRLEGRAIFRAVYTRRH